MDDARPVAVVTGAGRGIGREIAVALARRGSDLVLAARDVSALDETASLATPHGVEALPRRTDVTVDEDVAALAKATLERFGRVDALVANSGIGGPTRPLWELDRATWDEVVAVNLTGVFLCCRAFLPAMLERRSGAIVVVGSMTGKRPLWGRTPYAASKTGLIGLVRTLALELGPHGVRVNLVSPGPVNGPRIDSVFRAQAEARGITPEEARREMLGPMPIGRLIEPAEVADAVARLALDGNAAITGEDLNVSGGLVTY